MSESYFDVYAARVNARGGIRHKTVDLWNRIREFDRFLTDHPSVDPIHVRGEEHNASIVTNKQDPSRLTKKVLVSLNTPLTTGDIFTWKGREWIVFQQEDYPNEPNLAFWAVRCNYLLKWVNAFGVEEQSPSYVVSSEESRVKQNFRTWNGLITPQPNQHVGLLMPYFPFSIEQRFLIGDRAWFVAEKDDISVPGIVYVSLTETKIDRADDDRAAGLADYTDLGSWGVETLSSTMQVELDTPTLISPFVRYKGGLQDSALYFEASDPDATITITGPQTALIEASAACEFDLTISLVEEPRVSTVVHVVAATSDPEAELPEDPVTIVGDSFIRMGTTTRYVAYNHKFQPIDAVVVSDETFATAKLIDGMAHITANSNMKIGPITVDFTVGDQTVTLPISIRPIW